MAEEFVELFGGSVCTIQHIPKAIPHQWNDARLHILLEALTALSGTLSPS
jgi:hypothetical protein